MQKISLYIAATPWNFLNSFVFALQRKDEQSYLMYVDFPIGQDNPYLNALGKMGEESPFKASWCFHGKFKGAWKKWRSRVNELTELRQIVAQLKPDQVFVGSDRRIEFQCAMTEALKHKPNVKGIYLDEGMFSYTGRPRSQTWRDRVLDSWIKRLMYPCDWKHPITIGASDWISEGWLLKPERACGLLHNSIELKELSVDLYRQLELNELKSMLWQPNGACVGAVISALVLLPHPSQLSSEMKKTYRRGLKDDSGVVVKPHPRSNESIDWLEKKTMILPSTLPLELILAGVSVHKVVSAQTTALLTTKLMHPKAKVVLIEPVSMQFKELIENL